MSEYCGFITRISTVLPHDNADNLQLCFIFNNQVVIDKMMQEGDIVFYVPTDMQLGLEFCKENGLLKSQGGYLDDNKRNIKCIKLRGQTSDGLVLPLVSLSKFTDVNKLVVGDKISVLNGVQIVSKYIPQNEDKTDKNENHHIIKENELRLKHKYPLFAQHLDTEQLDYNLNKFNLGDDIVITEKLHGTSQRTSFNLATEHRYRNFVQRQLDKLLFKKPMVNYVRKYVTGTRKTIVNNKKDEFNKTNLFRLKYHNDFEFKNKLKYGEEVYYEVVGYLNENTPIMPSGNNLKTKDKEFIKRYGSTTTFSYGCESGENNIYVYRMTMTNEDGYVVEYPWDLVKLRCEEMGIKYVPELARFVFTSKEDLMKIVNSLLDIPSAIDSKHVSEGIVVRRNNATRYTAFKKKGWFFKTIEGLIKEAAVEPDIEEKESII